MCVNDFCFEIKCMRGRITKQLSAAAWIEIIQKNNYFKSVIKQKNFYFNTQENFSKLRYNFSSKLQYKFNQIEFKSVFFPITWCKNLKCEILKY